MLDRTLTMVSKFLLPKAVKHVSASELLANCQVLSRHSVSRHTGLGIWNGQVPPPSSQQPPPHSLCQLPHALGHTSLPHPFPAHRMQRGVQRVVLLVLRAPQSA